nr:hypothetical protein [Tanacetum cinerariifolium]
MTSLTSMCELACQIVQKKLEEKQLEEEQAAKAQNWKLPFSYDDDDDEERIDETDCHPEEETHFTKRLLYDNSSPRPSEEFVSENSNADIESFSPSPIPIKDSNSHMEEINLSFNPDDPMPSGIKEKSPDLLPHQGLKAFQSSAECPMMINGKNIPILDVHLFHFYPPLSTQVWGN